MNTYKAQITALLAQSDKSPLDTAIFLTRRSNEHRRDVWRVSRDEAVAEWIEKDRALFELQLDALYRVKASAPSAADLVKLIGETINNTISFGSIRTKWFAGPEDEGIETIATAVLLKLRAEGVIR